MKTAVHQAAAEISLLGESSVSFEDMGADLHALYSGKDSMISLDTLAEDLRALYGTTTLPVSINDLLAELRELYGDIPVSWADLSADFEALYTVHAV